MSLKIAILYFCSKICILSLQMTTVNGATLRTKKESWTMDTESPSHGVCFENCALFCQQLFAYLLICKWLFFLL